MSVAGYYDTYWDSSRDVRHYEPAPELAGLVFRGIDAGTSVLDVGCGAGNSYAGEVARRARSWTGVDVSASAIEAARGRGLDARVIDDATELPFPDDSFDKVLCVEVLEHLFEPHKAAAEMHRVLRPGGELVASAPNVAYWRLRAMLALGVWNPVGDELSVEQPWRDPHIRFFTPQTLERMLRQAGFSGVEIGAHGGRGLDHISTRPTAFGQSRVYRAAERLRPSLFGLTIHVAAVK